MSLRKCCRAVDAWRAGVTAEQARDLYEIPCTDEEAENCRTLWELKERIELYKVQSRLAKAGDARLLQHLGRVVLGQDSARIEDPGIGDLVFMLPPDTGSGEPAIDDGSGSGSSL